MVPNYRYTVICALLCCSLWLAPSSGGFAQSNEQEKHSSNQHPQEGIAIAFAVGPHFNFHTGSFLWPITSEHPCGPYQQGSGMGVGLVSWIELPPLFQSDQMRPVLGLELRGKSGTFNESEIFPVGGGGVNPPEPAEFQHEFSPSMSEIVASAGIRFVVSDDFATGQISLRPHVGFGTILASDWTQTVTEETTNETTTTSGALDNTESQWYLGALLTNSIEVSNSLQLTQNLQYQFALNNVVNEVDWQAHSLTFSIGIRGILTPEEETIPQDIDIPLHTEDIVVPVVDTVLTITPTIDSSDLIQRLDITIQQSIDTAWLEVGTELTSLYSLAIVNAVFFDSASADIPSLYGQQTQSIQQADTPLEAHSNVLVDLVATLNNNPKAVCNLIGATSGKSEEPLELARARAENVKLALIAMGVSANRIIISHRELPQYPSNSEFEEGREENRRVDIELVNAPSVTYVKTRTFRRLLAQQSYGYSIVPKEQVQHVEVATSDRTFESRRPQLQDSSFLSVRLRDEQREVPIELGVTVNDTLQEKAIATIDVTTLEQRVVEQDMRRFRPLLRFNYNSSVLTNEHKELLEQMASTIPGKYNLVVRGTSDALGSTVRNEQLRKERAKHVASYLRKLVPSEVGITTEVGPGTFSAETPAGRFLNRAIQILVLPQ